MIELSLIKLMQEHAEWKEATDRGLSIQDFPKELQPVFSVMDSFHSGHEESLSHSDLSNLLFAGINKNHPYYVELLANLEKLDVSNTTSKILLNKLISNRQLKELSLKAYDVTEGRATPEQFNELVDRYRASGEPSEKEQDEELFVTDDLEQLVHAAVSKPGLRFRLNTLNKMMGSLRKGNFGFVFARPETGKTTFLASEVTFMCEQLADEEGPIIWLANEEPGVNVKLRVYQAFFGITLAQLMSDIPKWSSLFNQKTRGKVKILDRAIIHKSVVDKLCRQHKPSLMIVDQIDKITGFDNDREDLRLGSIYQWFRELAKTYCPVIGVCQADGTGEGVKWLTMGHVANAKTAKQAEADWILGIGKQNAEGYENIRYLHLSKNKLLGDSDTVADLRHGKAECLIDATTARYKDI